MRKGKQRFFFGHTIFYSAFPITEQTAQGVWDYELKAGYTVVILSPASILGAGNLASPWF
ncbi:MAG: hypothetical protein GF344_02755 [Chitinivibrionales bacterium]|nr:hypothetical protein [Chitinivibrionales bacterium]